MSLSSVVAAIGLPVLMALSGGSSAYVVVFVASLMVLWRYRSNIERLLAGTDPRSGRKPPIWKVTPCSRAISWPLNGCVSSCRRSLSREAG